MGSLKVLILVMILGCFEPIADGLGVNWGTMASHPLPSKTVVQLLKDNGIKKVKLFDADSGSMNALAGSGLEVMVAIPNKFLSMMTDYATAKKWVNRNVTGYNFNGGVNIKYVAVGNEPFLSSYNGSFRNVTLPALQNIQKALNEAGVGSTIKATVPLNAEVYQGDVPSAGQFRTDISGLMTQIVTFLNQSGAPFMVNIYPFLSLHDNAGFPFEYTFFDNTGNTVTDNGVVYTNVFDANFDTLVSALKAINFGSMEIIVGEVGWPTDGDINAKAANAQRFYAGLMKKLAANTGTPLRPNQYIEMYLFGIIDEDAKSVAPGNFERHWGVLKYDGQPKFNMDLTGQGRSVTLVPAKGVEYQPKTWCLLNPKAQNNMTALANNINYACTNADCTSLGYGSTCNGLDSSGNASYAFNAYFQVQSQVDGSCDFEGLATVTTQDPSTNGCNFTIQIVLDDSFGLRATVPVQINLETNEYITNVKGYINDDYYGQEVVMSLVLETNLAVYGPYGTEKGKSFELPAHHGKIIGFHARHGIYVNAVGVYVQATSPIMKKGPFGAPRGTLKDMDPMGITRIVKITINHSDVIDALTVYFERNGTPQCTNRWGGDGGTMAEIIFKTNEYVTFVKGYINEDHNGHKVVMALTLETNLAFYGPYGTEEGEYFEFPAIDGKIVGFHARYEKYVNAVGVYVQSITPIIKKGPIGSTGLSVKNMDPAENITRIVKISIHHSEVIDALIVYFERNGTMECTGRWGGGGGNVTKIDLKENEYITYVKGYYNDDYYGHEVVMSLVMKTNLAIYGPFGKENGQSFELSALHGQIIGFHALHGKYVNAIGVYVQASGPIMKKGPTSSSGELVKDMDPTHITRIVKISVRHSYVIDALTVYFERNGRMECTDQWGGHGGNVTEINLKPYEYIKSVKGYIDNFHDDPTVSSLLLETNIAIYGPFGMEKGEPFELSAPHSQIIGFHARHGKYINAIGCHVQAIGPIIKKGPIGGSGGGVQDMDPIDITRIVKICIYHDNAIQGLNVYFERYGITESTNNWGRTVGKATEINLETNEYIMSVRGSCGNHNDHWVVKSLVLKTNLDTYGPYGWEEGESLYGLEEGESSYVSEEGESSYVSEEEESLYGTGKGKFFELSPLHGQIIGFHAQAGWHLDAIGVYIKAKGPIIKKGPIGSSGESVKSMDPTRITRIVKITVHHSDVINALSVHFERNGTTTCTDQWGGNGGNVNEIDLKTNEYITSVKGYIDNLNNSPTVSSLLLETNLGVYGPYGTEKGKSFELSAIEGQIIGFHARFGTYVNTIGVYVKPFKRKLVLCGGSGGLPKDMDLTGLTRIVSVSIRHSNSAIDSLSVDFDRNGTTESTSHWGGNTGALTEISLKPEEYIKSVRGYVGYFGDLFIVRSLELETNIKVYGPFGKQEGTPFELSAPDSHIVGFHGRSGAYLDAIGVYALLPANRRI